MFDFLILGKIFYGQWMLNNVGITAICWWIIGLSTWLLHTKILNLVPQRDRIISDKWNVCLAFMFSNYAVYNKYVKQTLRSLTLRSVKEPQENKISDEKMHLLCNIQAAINQKHKLCRSWNVHDENLESGTKWSLEVCEIWISTLDSNWRNPL